MESKLVQQQTTLLSQADHRLQARAEVEAICLDAVVESDAAFRQLPNSDVID